MEFNATFIITAISFIIFVFLMNTILYRPLEKIVDERAKKQNSDTLNNAEFCVISKNRIVFNNRLAVNVKRLFRLPFLSAFFNKSGLIDCQTLKNRTVAVFVFCNSPFFCYIGQLSLSRRYVASRSARCSFTASGYF